MKITVDVDIECEGEMCDCCTFISEEGSYCALFGVDFKYNRYNYIYLRNEKCLQAERNK